jgi:putative redox protein
MKLETRWKEKLKFTAVADGHEVPMDTRPPLGDDSALTPKHLLLAAICGCTAMDVVALLKKLRQPPESLSIEADAPMTEGSHPHVFSQVRLTFKLTGPLDASKAVEAVRLSQTKYCGVSAMVAKAVPILYTIELNGNVIGEGRADFQTEDHAT